MQAIFDFIREYSAYFVLGLCALSLVLLICSISISVKISRIARRRNSHLESGAVGDIVDKITEQSSAIDSLQKQLDNVVDDQRELSRLLTSCVQKSGMVRFNAFDDVGGEQSFALALLDAKNNGIIISSLYGRQDCRTYIKGISNGEAERTLSDEEKRALTSAQGK